MLRRMKISVLTLDPETKTPIVVLKDPETETFLHMSIGIAEATAIATELEGIRFTRPMTHDLLKNLTIKFGIRVIGVEVCDLRDRTFYAWIYLSVNGKRTRVDSRPSDALALALRTNAPIYVNERVFEKLERGRRAAEAAIEDRHADKWTEILENMSPEDFGKYKM
ncbi:MAG: bifunctional nuclease family protein [Deltaproteobacteria bacterium]|nr:bifunctional nuclease family protein [Deltaproteobacteria bacterium]MBW2071406.1 bifunctional nuclease family protein [Deltaproteobacteria bacterium]